MTNPSSDFERWGEAQFPDLEAEVRELAVKDGFEVVFAQPADQDQPNIYVDDQDYFDVTSNGETVRYRVGYIKTNNENV